MAQCRTTSAATPGHFYPAENDTRSRRWLTRLVGPMKKRHLVSFGSSFTLLK
jgi:hypothetical protein